MLKRTVLNLLKRHAWQRVSGESGVIESDERRALMIGRLLANGVRDRRCIGSLHEVEFAVFSQWGDDGIIQWLVANIGFQSQRFIEFGVQDYRESTTRFLMMNDNWSGLVMDGLAENVARIRSSYYYWRYELLAECAFIDRDNINGLLQRTGLSGPVGILHIDIDGNDYWIWEAISVVDAELVIVEYNAVFGADRAITVPYKADFFRTDAHFTNLYFGASLAALTHLASTKGYVLIGCTSVGNNAYFLRRDKLVEPLKALTVAQGFVPSKFRESRDREGRLSLLSGAARLEVIRTMPVIDVLTGRQEAL